MVGVVAVLVGGACLAALTPGAPAAAPVCGTLAGALSAGVGELLSAALDGLEIDETVWGNVVGSAIAGALAGGLSGVAVEVLSSSRWTRTNRSLTLSALIPPNATATIRVPLLGATKVTAPPGARLLHHDTEHFVYAVPSGSWTFRTD